MTRPASISTLAPQFDDFFYASIGEEKNGMLLSVLSALARQGLDPWEEAAGLTLMPTEAAIRKMSCSISALPEDSLPRPNAESTATRLIRLLPRPPHSERPTQQTPRSVDPAKQTVAVRHLVFVAVFIVLMLCNEWLTNRTESGAEAEPRPAPVSQFTAQQSSPNSE